MTVKRLVLVWVMILCLMPMNVRGDSVMNDFHYDNDVYSWLFTTTCG